MASASPAASPASQQSLLTASVECEEASSRRHACKKLGWATAAFGFVIVIGLSLVYSAPAVPKAAAGVHYGAMSLPTGNAKHEPVMTDGPGGVHYLVHGTASGPLPTPGPMTAGYREVAEMAGEDLLFVKWLVAAGDIVQAGDPLLVFSKDGHQLQLKASSSGQIKEIVDAAEGKLLSKGTKIAIFGHPPPQSPIFVNLRSPLAGSAFLLLMSMGFIGVILTAVALVLSRDPPTYKKVTSLEDGLARAADVPDVPRPANLSSASVPAAAGLQAAPAPVYVRAPATFSVPIHVPAMSFGPAPVPAVSSSQPAGPAPTKSSSLTAQSQPAPVQDLAAVQAKVPKAEKADSSPSLPRLSRSAAEAAHARMSAAADAHVE